MRTMKGQVSTELLVIVAVVLLIFIPLLVMVYIKTSDANAQISSYQAELAVFRLAYLANSVGALGSNASVTTDVFVPSGVSELKTSSVGRGGEIVMKLHTPQGDTEITEVVKYPITNPQQFPTASGWARFMLSSVYDNGQFKGLSITSTR
jgi:uncharacterized protein (UPF0333 family)